MGQHEAAQEQLVTAVSLRPGDAGIRMRLAESYRRSGAVDDAIATYQSVMDLRPGSRHARRAESAIRRIEQGGGKPPKVSA
jgi:Flp pilus assembly protein TadD